jgi:anti-anti-sigma factor
MVAIAPASVGSSLAPGALFMSRDRGRTVVWLDGEHDLSTSFVVARSLARATSADDADVIVDLSGVTFFGAATLGVMVRSQNLLRSQHRTLLLRSPSGCVRRVLDACGLAGMVEPQARPPVQ